VAPPSLSVVIPAFNEAGDLPGTIAALRNAVDRSGFDAELVLVDDGSSDGSADAVRAAVDGGLPLRVLSGPNRGRFDSRRTGVGAARAEYVLLLDARVRIDADALAYVEEQVGKGKRIWTADVRIDAEDEPFALFWKLIAELAWSDYFDEPRETNFGAEDFDRFPKGTTCFFAPRQLLLDAIAAFRSRYPDLRDANDDTPLLRWVAERERINVSPGFACRYAPRASFASFVRHSVHRGVVFLDGHGRAESRFFPLVLSFYPLSAALLLATLKKPSVAPVVLAGTSLAAATLGVTRRRTAREVVSLALVTPVYGVAHGYGMWRGLWTMLRRRRANGPRP
jgi:glycosyltransferase involved in cell wall biosynthesis